MKILRFCIAITIVVLFFSTVFSSAYAATYGSDSYSSGTYNTGGSTQTSGSNSSNSSASAPSCGDQSPGAKAPWLYGAIAQNSVSILLYFTEAGNPVDKYVLEYGTSPGKYQYGVQNMGVNSRSQMTFLVGLLFPNTTYYFRVRGGNGCATGPWSNEISATTKSLLPFNSLDIVSSDLQEESVEKPQKQPASSQCSYTVQSGDGLWSIAKKTLGSGSRFTEIIDLNKETYPSLNTSHVISTGWVLNLGCSNSDQKQDTQNIAKPKGYDVNVTVTDEKKKPIAGAKVTLHSTPKESLTDKEGVARFNDIEPGQHQVIIAYTGFSGEQSINLTGDVKTFNLNVQVKPTNILTSPLVMGIIGILTTIIIILVTLLFRKRTKVH